MSNGYKNDLSIDEMLMITIVRIAEGFKKNQAAVFKRWGLTFSQYNLLRVLDSSENGQNTMKNVNRIMLVSSANMTGIAKRLEKSGFIVRKNDPGDDRLKWMQITPEGIQVLRAISDYKEQDLTRYLMKYSDNKKSGLLETLQAILRQARSKQTSNNTMFESQERFAASVDVS